MIESRTYPTFVEYTTQTQVSSRPSTDDSNDEHLYFESRLRENFVNELGIRQYPSTNFIDYFLAIADLSFSGASSTYHNVYHLIDDNLEPFLNNLLDFIRNSDMIEEC